MVKNLLSLTLSFLLISLNISCKKDPVSDANPGGTSAYAFEGSPSGCTTPVIAGIYSVGTALSASNTATFSVNVTIKGSYSIRTTSANGIYFSGSGEFTNTGSQTVVLTGIGTPVRSGYFSFVPATSNTCNFAVSFTAGGPSAIFTFGGAPAACTAPIVGGTYSTGIALGAGNYVDLAVNVTTAGAYTISTNSANGISFSGSGTFTAPGAQVVRLIGNGSPAATGSFTYRANSNGCDFSITVVPPAPPATFTYNGGTGNCTTPVINGTYTAGTALSAGNTIVLGVNVTIIGSYSVTTNSSNGVVFSGSGNFSSIGANTITLTSNSTPGAAGPFTYTPTGGCSFSITYTGAPPPPADFLKCTINGVVTDFNDNMFGLSDQTSSPYTFAVTGDISGVPGSTANFSIDLTDNSNPIVNGNYNNISATNTNKGCFVTYSPVFGSTTPFVTGLLNNNSFTVTITSITLTRATGTFSGTLYDNFGMGPGTKNITAGSFSIGY